MFLSFFLSFALCFCPLLLYGYDTHITETQKMKKERRRQTNKQIFFFFFSFFFLKRRKNIFSSFLYGGGVDSWQRTKTSKKVTWQLALFAFFLELVRSTIDAPYNRSVYFSKLNCYYPPIQLQYIFWSNGWLHSFIHFFFFPFNVCVCVCLCLCVCVCFFLS